MSTSTSQFDYDLPPDCIAQEPIEPKDQSKLLVLDKETGDIQHSHFYKIGSFLRDDDVLVFNKTKVFKARLQGKAWKARKARKAGEARKASDVEVFLLRARNNGWEAMIRPGRKVPVGSSIELESMSGKVLEKHENGSVLIDFGVGVDEVLEYCDKYGEVPTPPYVKQATDEAKYQTVYAEEVGSVAAPTAGFHFTDRLIGELRARGIQMEFVTLHVGIGTFQPVKTETLEEHVMHAEFVEIDAGTAMRLNQVKEQGRRVVAVGTTTTRALEGASRTSHVARGKSFQNDERRATCDLQAFSGDVNIFITPGYDFKMIDALITNFHLPKSTLIAMVSALSDRKNILNAYEEAKKHNYRFYSFGDAMFLQ